MNSIAEVKWKIILVEPGRSHFAEMLDVAQIYDLWAPFFWDLFFNLVF